MEVICIFTDQSEQLQNDQSECAIPTNQESAIWTNQGPGWELYKREPPSSPSGSIQAGLRAAHLNEVSFTTPQAGDSCRY